jgi:hypothetical protein
LAIYLGQDEDELLDDSGWLPSDLQRGPTEFFCEPEFCEGWVGFAAADGSDKKRCSSAAMLHSLLTILEHISPSSIGMPSSSPNSFSKVIGLFAGCSLRLAHMVSAWMATKSLLAI